MRMRLVSMLLVLGTATASLGAESIPAEVAQLYDKEADASVSDDFDGPALDTSKWDYRTSPAPANWQKSNVSIESDGPDHYLNLHGEWRRSVGADGFIQGTGSSSGVYSKSTMGHGFYTTRWRVKGIRANNKSTWHPAIWCHRAIVSTTKHSRLPNDHIELDLIEFSQNRTTNIKWHSQAVEWIQDREGKNQMIPIEGVPYNSDFQEGVWSTHGLEYHPEYVQLWKYDEASHEWSRAGKKITITSSPTDKKRLNINENSAHDQAYWILSNYDFFDRVNEIWKPYHGRQIKDDDNFLMSDSSLQIDYFRFRALRAVDDAD